MSANPSRAKRSRRGRLEDLATDTNQEALSSSTRELLAWIASSPRTYAETLEVWRTNCPRDPVWEDAVIAGLVQVGHDQEVVLTARGRAVLDRRLADAPQP